jgi:hypothetical protein
MELKPFEAAAAAATTTTTIIINACQYTLQFQEIEM